jgi:hypothetical protein
MKLTLPLLIALAASLPAARAQTPPTAPIPDPPAFRDLLSDTWAATDSLGRSLPTAVETRSPRKDRFVGVFYFLTHGSKIYYAGGPKPDYSTYGSDPRVLNDNTKIIRAAGGDTVSRPEAWKNVGEAWWGEPAVGYFLADDAWVARRDLRMLGEAGVDMLIFDVTNGPTYPKAYETVLDAAEEMRKAGNRVPQFAFITYSSTGAVVNGLYDRLYSKGLYSNLWFRWQGKPLIFGDPNGSKPVTIPPRPEARDFFTWRYSWANTNGPTGDGKDEWQWIDARGPQTFGWHASPSVPEQAPVAIAGWAHENLGRSFHAREGAGTGRGVEPPHDDQFLAADVDKGPFFAQQWRQALKIDPQFLFITGWNEWTAGRQYAPGVGMIGRTTKTDQYYFVDNFNEEFSRDAMPMKGGYADNYYLQLVDGIRRYKGVRPAPVAHGARTIALDRGFAQWENVAPRYLDAVGDTDHRDWPGWAGKQYVNTTGRNDLTSAKVACDARNVYFYVHAKDALTPHTDPNWMHLLIDADRNPATGWNGYDFVVNGRVIDAGTTTLRRFSDGREWRVPYRAVGNEMQIAIPRALLALREGRSVAFDFHWADNVAVGSGSPADWWYNGDSAPDGRFNYRYSNDSVGGKP